MESKEFSFFRKKLEKTQREIAQLLGTSIKAVHSYEQGWRSIPVHVERQMLFLLTRQTKGSANRLPCWKIKDCPDNLRSGCPAWEFQTGDLCWFINGTICDGRVHENWKEKMKSCRACEVFSSQL
ncbi:MAG: XRE family transcriptional regulator [Desulfobacteraceae bacterium]|jgi:hypothetical protein|nr:MAG: XRE family transcriptional regulator [Desulfobacteraceae bacterium]